MLETAATVLIVALALFIIIYAFIMVIAGSLVMSVFKRIEKEFDEFDHD